MQILTLQELLILLVSLVSVCSKGASLQPVEDHMWIVTEWSQCSSSCGGVRVRAVHCVSKYGKASSLCRTPMPVTHLPCNKDKCTKAGTYGRHRRQRMSRFSHASRIEMSASQRVEQTHLKSPTIRSQLPLRQTSPVLLDWTVSEWTECSATCGGGFRVRSVRCLDECGIISPQYQRCNTSKDNRPSTYEFCAQVDCITGIMDSDILPPDGSTEFSIQDGSFSVLDFSAISIERYQIRQNITENDGTLTLLTEAIRNGMSSFSCEARPADVTVTVRQVRGRNVIFLNGEFLFDVDCVVTTLVRLGEIVTYTNSTVAIRGRDIEFTNITTFWYCDSFRCYTFNTSKPLFERTGPTSKLFTSKDVALYSITGSINLDIEEILANPPIITTSAIPIVTPTPTIVVTSMTTAFISVVLTSTSTLFIETMFTSIVPTPAPSPLSTVTVSPSITVLVTTPEGISPTPAVGTITSAIVPSTLVLATPTPTATPDGMDPTRDKPRPCPRKTKFTKTKPFTRTTKPISKSKTKFTDFITKTTESRATDTLRTKHNTQRSPLESPLEKTASTRMTKSRGQEESTEKTYAEKTRVTWKSESICPTTRGTGRRKSPSRKKTRVSHGKTQSRSDRRQGAGEIAILLIEVPVIITDKYCSHLDKNLRMAYSTISKLQSLLLEFKEQFLEKKHVPKDYLHGTHQPVPQNSRHTETTPKQSSFDCYPDTDCTFNRREVTLNQAVIVCEHYGRHLFSCLYAGKVLHCGTHGSEKTQVSMTSQDFSIFIVAHIDLKRGKIKKTLNERAICCFEDDLNRELTY